jgi:hypothetical protein
MSYQRSASILGGGLQK